MNWPEPNLPLNKLSKVPPLKPDFYERDTVTVARALLGKGLYVRQKDTELLCEIVETEAYLGPGKDPASHAYRGETPRNRSMFQGGGVCYVYFCYGAHFCMNVVTGKAGTGTAVLIRAAVPLLGHETMRRNRRLSQDAHAKQFLSGPGKLAQGLGVDKSLDGVSFQSATFKIIDLGKVVSPRAIGQSPRIGISQAKEAHLRFYLKSCEWLSRKNA